MRNTYFASTSRVLEDIDAYFRRANRTKIAFTNRLFSLHFSQKMRATSLDPKARHCRTASSANTKRCFAAFDRHFAHFNRFDINATRLFNAR